VSTVTKRLRFGICTDQNLPWPTLVQRWKLYEELGFDSVWDCDHYVQPEQPHGPYFEGWTLLAGLAAVTSRIRIGVLVSCNTFRHPALLAKEAVTVDHISSGRLELGVGAGWYEPEHAMFGIELPPPGERVSRFEEAVVLVDQLLRHDVVTFAGLYYAVRDAEFRPGPIQKPRPPLTIGAHGPRMLKLCARYADRWNSFGSVDEIRGRNQILDECCAQVGRDPGAIVRSLYAFGETPSATPWDSVGAFEDTVGRYREVGISEFIIDQPTDDHLHTLQRVAEEVIPALRA
jgi:alkanesulfonate monooxygenase SsuD/methylene tetrahydromethanopterin reductase-like flavin-dependent oxidoreductase (luciferase family)